MGDHCFVKTIVSGFVPANKQDRRTPRIESIEPAQRLSTALDAQFTHMRVFRAFNPCFVIGVKVGKESLDLAREDADLVKLGLR